MKRVSAHLLFWLVYFIQDMFIHYTWMEPLLPNTPESTQFWMAIETALVVLVPKLFIVYYLLTYGVKKLINNNHISILLVAEILFLGALSVICFRVMFHYFINPKIYGITVTTSLFKARHVLIAIIEIGYVVGIAITLKLLRKQISSKERERNLVKEKLQTELKFLKNQTNPHFLFNTLNNIYALARKKSDKTPEVVMKLSELLSFMLYESSKETIPIAEEIKMMEDYIDLEKIRYNERLSICLKKEIDDGSQKITPLILLPLVENAFKHGVSETRFDSYIHIAIQLKEGLLSYDVENSIENGKPKKLNNNIGLTNIRRQLELMYKEHKMFVQKDEKVFKVSIVINLNSYGKI